MKEQILELGEEKKKHKVIRRKDGTFLKWENIKVPEMPDITKTEEKS
jgi:hypothetical protein